MKCWCEASFFFHSPLDGLSWTISCCLILLQETSVRPIQWLHISDIHIRADQEWSQDVVLKSMCENISDLRQAEGAADFILVTGDIAFSGKCKEYALAGKFFDDLQKASGVPRERIFCIPGNHDIDRTRQKLTFEGALNALNNTSKLDAFLAGGGGFGDPSPKGAELQTVPEFSFCRPMSNSYQRWSWICS